MLFHFSAFWMFEVTWLGLVSVDIGSLASAHLYIYAWNWGTGNYGAFAKMWPGAY